MEQDSCHRFAPVVLQQAFVLQRRAWDRKENGTEHPVTLDDFLEILKRRKHFIIWPALLIFITSALVAFLIPPTYRSTSTILIEEQDIPEEYVMSTVTSYAEQRIQSINERIMSSTKLMEVINRFNLYADQRKSKSIEEISEEMRKDIKLETINAQVANRRGGSSSATIAFSVAYEGSKPDVVQQVAGVLASMYLEENLKIREQQATGATRFIEEEMNSLKAKLADLDAKLAAFKSRNLGSLPELVQSNLLSADRIDQDIGRLQDQLATLKEREESIKTQNPDKNRLQDLQAQLINLKTRLTEKHPDVVIIKKEIAELERRVNAAEKEGKVSGDSDNLANRQFAAQLSSTQSEIRSVQRQIDEMTQKRNVYLGRVSASPGVEERYRVLLMERNNTQAKYEDLMKKGLEANVSYGMEKGQLGERFTIIDPARLPVKPVKPNIPAILLIGFILGIGGGVGAASLKEFSDQSVRTKEALAEATSMTVLAGIPEIGSQQDIDQAKRRRSIWVIRHYCLHLGESGDRPFPGHGPGRFLGPLHAKTDGDRSGLVPRN